MKKMIKQYTVITLIICCMTIGAAAIIIASEKSSAMAFGTKAQKIQLSEYIDTAELKEHIISIFSFLPFRE